MFSGNGGRVSMEREQRLMGVIIGEEQNKAINK